MNIIKTIANRLYLTRQSRRVRPWFAVDGDNSLRLDYSLSKDSIVFDLGGYKGQFASDIFSKYCCSVYVFEPVIAFCNAIQKRFEANDNIHVFPFGLADKEMDVFINVDSDRSAIALKGEERIHLKGFDYFLEQHRIQYVDLIKFNIEGAEYDLLDHIIANNLQKKIINFQIQFHDFVPFAQDRMVSIQKNLEKTHELTWCFPFVWENWRLKEHI